MKIDVLDHGYVMLIESWGHGLYEELKQYPGGHIAHERDMEAGIIEAARQSTQGSFRGWDTDAKLLRHLYENKHLTPFEFAGLVVEVQAPIFVFREWHRHRTQSYNEMSARYEPLPDLYYYPTPDRMMMSGGTNKQAQGVTSEPMQLGDAEGLVHCIAETYEYDEDSYRVLLNRGAPKELARCVVPVGHYSRMRAVGNLRNWLAFLTLRTADDAQWEIRQFAKVVGDIIAKTFPRTYQLWKEEPRIRCAYGHLPILHPEGKCPLCTVLYQMPRSV